jgi:hypothetical protein
MSVVAITLEPHMRSAEMYRVDITADLNDEDHTGYVWTFLDEARDPCPDPARRRRGGR